MDKQNLYPPDQYPPTNIIAAAIRNLPKAGPGVRAQKVEIDAGPSGRYRVTFIVRQNAELSTPSWYWGVERSERVAEPGGGGPDDPGSGTQPD
jgi:hypothetical protein